MSRRHRSQKRTVAPDSKFQSRLIGQLINMITRRGKKSVARTIVYGAIEKVSEKLGKGDPVELLLAALENVQPKLEVKSRRVGGATYQVPVEISYERQQTLAFRWLIGLADGRKGVAMGEALAMEIVDAYNNTGAAVKRREEMHKMAQANRAFAHLNW
ncbi:MAG: 30S ribosomal protein S7 [Puniceicoccales bacterium]|jgi:small subunit ribosomal protein S7|nr:30S ribosomal protein S7 [Puniceicoccales bacterium]